MKNIESFGSPNPQAMAKWCVEQKPGCRARIPYCISIIVIRSNLLSLCLLLHSLISGCRKDKSERNTESSFLLSSAQMGKEVTCSSRFIPLIPYHSNPNSHITLNCTSFCNYSHGSQLNHLRESLKLRKKKGKN